MAGGRRQKDRRQAAERQAAGGRRQTADSRIGCKPQNGLQTAGQAADRKTGWRRQDRLQTAGRVGRPSQMPDGRTDYGDSRQVGTETGVVKKMVLRQL